MTETLDTTIGDLQLGEVPLTPEQMFDYFDAYGFAIPQEFFTQYSLEHPTGLFATAPIALQGDVLSRFLADPALTSYLDTVFVEPTTGQLVLANGAPVDPNIASQIMQALGEPVPGGQDATEVIDPELARRAIGDPAEFDNVVQSLTPEEQQRLNAIMDEANAGGGMERILKAVNDFTGTNIGRILATLALGAAGLGAARLFAGDAPTINLPGPAAPPASVQAAQQALTRGLTTPAALTPRSTRQAVLDASGNLIGYQNPDGTVTPASASTGGATPRLSELAPGRTGQEDLEQAFRLGLWGSRNAMDLTGGRVARELQTDVEQAPQERAVRQAAITGLPDMLVSPEALAAGEPVTPMDDVIRDYLREAIGRAMRGEYASPALERRLRLEEEATRNRLRTGLGPDYELSTGGIQGVNEFRDYANTLREEENRRYLSSYLPHEESRGRFAVQFPEEVRRAGVNERLALSNFGRRTAPELVTSLNAMVPIQPLLGLGDTAASSRLNEQLQANAAISAFNAENQNRRDLSAGIGGLAGTAAAIGLAPRTLRLSDGRVGEWI